ncbi:MAG: DUF305 domain-containing protein [Actinobacteria bacterium]|nr:DUF305 domain-containing protein [Actinomycetota bacterium]
MKNQVVETILTEQEVAEIRELAQAIVKGQQAEIETLQSIVAEAK